MNQVFNQKVDNPGCFICEPLEIDKTQELPSQWLKPRYVCLEHKIPILKNGQTIRSFLDRYKNGYLEGSGLNYFLNPVTINGIRCWADFAAGGYAIFEELFPANNYFEFQVQNNPFFLEVLYFLYKGKDNFSNGYSLKILTETMPVKYLNNDEFNNICSCWNTNFKIQHLLTERGRDFVENPEEIFEILSEVGNFDYKDINKVVFYLIDISKRRFSHIKI